MSSDRTPARFTNLVQMSRLTFEELMGLPGRVAKMSSSASPPVRCRCASSSRTTQPDSATVRPPADPFWARNRRHKVVVWTLAYVAFAYALLHGVQMLREAFEWPYLVSRLTVLGLVLAAPIAEPTEFSEAAEPEPPAVEAQKRKAKTPEAAVASE